jgi:hypothetical protein
VPQQGVVDVAGDQEPDGGKTPIQPGKVDPRQLAERCASRPKWVPLPVGQ